MNHFHLYIKFVHIDDNFVIRSILKLSSTKCTFLLLIIKMEFLPCIILHNFIFVKGSSLLFIIYPTSQNFLKHLMYEAYTCTFHPGSLYHALPTFSPRETQRGKNRNTHARKIFQTRHVDTLGHGDKKKGKKEENVADDD